MSQDSKQEKIIVSACLAGVECRYDCEAKSNSQVQDLAQKGIAFPVCPEQLGGLPTPRPPAERIGEKVLDVNDQDVTEEYQQGAKEALKLAKLIGAKKAILKSKSPMCGCGQIYSGNFDEQLVEGDGVFTELLKKNGIEVETK